MVALGVACILMIAVASFLVNGAISAKKTTAINDVSITGRHVFEHISKEMATSSDLKLTNFYKDGANDPSGPYNKITYRVNVGSPGVTEDTPLSSSTLQLTVSLVLITLMIPVIRIISNACVGCLG